MSKLLLGVLLGSFVLSLFALPAFGADPKEGKMLFHVVSLKFKEGTSMEQIKAVEDAFVGLKEKIPGIHAMTWGTNVSPEKHAKGFTHCFILAFNSEKVRDDYLPHPDHKAFGQVLGPVLADVFVIDFWGDVRQGDDKRVSN